MKQTKEIEAFLLPDEVLCEHKVSFKINDPGNQAPYSRRVLKKKKRVKLKEKISIKSKPHENINDQN